MDGWMGRHTNRETGRQSVGQFSCSVRQSVSHWQRGRCGVSPKLYFDSSYSEKVQISLDIFYESRHADNDSDSSLYVVKYVCYKNKF
jgi:hypothetical protein